MHPTDFPTEPKNGEYEHLLQKIKGCLTTSPNQFVNLKSNTIMKNHAAKIQLFFK